MEDIYSELLAGIGMTSTRVVEHADEFCRLVGAGLAAFYINKHKSAADWSTGDLLVPIVMAVKSTLLDEQHVTVHSDSYSVLFQLLDAGPVTLTLSVVSSPQAHAHILALAFRCMRSSDVGNCCNRAYRAHDVQSVAGRTAAALFMGTLMRCAGFKRAMFAATDPRMSASWVRRFANLGGRSNYDAWIKLVSDCIEDGAVAMHVPRWIADVDLRSFVLENPRFLDDDIIPPQKREVLAYVAAHAVSRAMSGPPDSANLRALMDTRPEPDNVAYLSSGDRPRAVAVTFAMFLAMRLAASRLAATMPPNKRTLCHSMGLCGPGAALRVLTLPPHNHAPYNNPFSVTLRFTSSSVERQVAHLNCAEFVGAICSGPTVASQVLEKLAEVFALSVCRLRCDDTRDDRVFAIVVGILQTMSPRNASRTIDHACHVLGTCSGHGRSQLTDGRFDSKSNDRRPNALTMYLGHVSEFSDAKAPRGGTVAAACWKCHQTNSASLQSCAGCAADLRGSEQYSLGFEGIGDHHVLSSWAHPLAGTEHLLHLISEAGPLGLYFDRRPKSGWFRILNLHKLEKSNDIFVIRLRDEQLAVYACICISTAHDAHGGELRTRYARGLAANRSMLAAAVISMVNVPTNAPHAAWSLALTACMYGAMFMEHPETYGVVCATVARRLAGVDGAETHASSCPSCARALASLYIGCTDSIPCPGMPSSLMLARMFLVPGAQAHSTHLTRREYARWAAIIAANVEMGPVPIRSKMMPAWVRPGAKVNLDNRPEDTLSIVRVDADGTVVVADGSLHVAVDRATLRPAVWHVPVVTSLIMKAFYADETNVRARARLAGCTDANQFHQQTFKFDVNCAVFPAIVNQRAMRLYAFVFSVLTATDVSNARDTKSGLPECLVLYILEMLIAGDVCRTVGDLAGWSAYDQLQFCHRLCMKRSIYREVPTVEKVHALLWT